jgi:sporulation-control protein spo0M
MGPLTLHEEGKMDPVTVGAIGVAVVFGLELTTSVDPFTRFL